MRQFARVGANRKSPFETRLVRMPLGLTSPLTQLIWIPIAIFETTVAFWFLIGGVAEPP